MKYLFPTGLSLIWVLAWSMPAQAQYAVLHNFNDGTVKNDGAYPSSGHLIEGPEGNFYGTTFAGGSAFFGVVYKVTRPGKVTILHSFNDGSVKGDGVGPSSGLIFGADGDLYGATTYGGTTDSVWPGFGTIYKITRKGQLTILHNFGDGTVANDGINPLCALVLGRDGNFYGTTSSDVTAGPFTGGVPTGTVLR
jgi:uncharacterized repeat protein (TIGR03803 family)